MKTQHVFCKVGTAFLYIPFKMKILLEWFSSEKHTCQR